MKIDRLIGIITILLQNKKVTAPYLAEKFEVSKRTINRDIEDICKAGIPVITLQGMNGGITIADGYKIDKTLFTEKELRSIFIGLSSLDSVAQDKKYRNIIDKFFADTEGMFATNHIRIDLSSHYKNSLAPKISDIQQGIDTSTEIAFTYYSSAGQRQVALEPYLIVFQWSNWYVFGFDLEKSEFRMFKLNRLWDLQNTDRSFVLRDVPDRNPDFSGYFTNEINAVILFDDSVKYRLIEEYGIDCYTSFSNGKVRFAFPFTSEEYLLEWVLGFGDKAELLEPKKLRAELKSRLEKSLEKYFE